MELAIDAWDGGITDHYLNGYKGAARRLHNLFLNDHKKPYQRGGIRIFNSSAPQLPPGNQQVDALYYFDSTTFIKSGTRLYYAQDGDVAWTTLAGPTGNDAFPDSELGAKCTWSEWRGHLFITPGPSANRKGGCRTQKVYRNASNTWVLVQAGLPRFSDATRSGLSSSHGSVGYTTIYQYLEARMFVRQYVARVNGVDTVFKDYGQPTITTDEYTSKISASNAGDFEQAAVYANLSTENYDTSNLRVEFFRSLADEKELLNSGSFTTTESILNETDDADLGNIALDIPATSNGTAGGVMGFGTTNIAFFWVGQQVTLDDDDSGSATRYVIAVNYAAGTATFSSTRGGAAVSVAAYTTAQNAFARVRVQSKMPFGYLDSNFNDPAPPSYFTAVADSFGWYAAPVDMASNFHRATRVTQSKPNDIDAVPSGNFVDIPTDKLTAFGLAGQYPVAFDRRSCYRIEGRIDAFGNGQLRAILISKTEGAISQDLALTPSGIYFMSENGFCWTDAFQVVNFSKRTLKATYQALSNKQNAALAFDSRAARVIFGVESAAFSSVTGNNNAAYVLDMAQTTDNQGVFTTMGALDGTSFQPTALHYDSKNQRLLIGDKRGYIFTLDDSVYTDPVVDTGAAASTWARQAVVWDYRSVAFSFGSAKKSKRMGSTAWTMKNLTGDLSVNFYSYKDDRATPRNMKLYRDRDNTTGLYKISRSYPKYHLNLVYSELQAKKGFVVIERSDDHAQATTNGAANTATLASGNWPLDGTDDLRGHALYLGPSYATGYTISSVAGGVVTVLDPGNTFPTNVTAVDWVVMGYPKNETVEFDTLTIEYMDYVEGYPERSGTGAND